MNKITHDVAVFELAIGAEQIAIHPLQPASISAAKARFPGAGVGPAVAGRLIELAELGVVQSMDQLPAEYRQIGLLLGLPEQQGADLG